MPTWAWFVIALAAVVVVTLVGVAIYSRRRRENFRTQFGPEYDRTVAETGSTSAAESELDQRRRRRESLNIRPLTDAARERYGQEWQAVQLRFVDEPAQSLSEADRLVARVMQERGYPMDDFSSRVGDISVDHPALAENFRAAHAIALASGVGRASTEDLRQGMVHFRALFEELLSGEDDSRQVVG